ncbi:hypothetical protein HYW41_05240 [Candidatus Daviesbacteria bacterium]|nr:hypothetical protein [Candidatus Daviesbacteria bacterium]
MTEVLSLIPTTVLGYYTFKATSHPTSRIRKRMPNVKLKRVQVFPVLRVYLFGRVFHLHHWFLFSILLILSIFASIGILDLVFTRGMLLGGIIQGLTLPKGHRKIVYRDFSYESLVSPSERK